MPRSCYKKLLRLSNGNGVIIADYLIKYKLEATEGVEDSTRITVCNNLGLFARKVNKPFKKVTREDVLLFLNGLKKAKAKDPRQKWRGTYKLYSFCIVQFFKWLYYPDDPPKRRKTPDVVVELPKPPKHKPTERTYETTDMWSQKEHEIFLKYCPDLRISCYHAIACFTGARPHEILGLRIGDLKWLPNGEGVVFKVTGKTGSRPLKIMLPYYMDFVKRWIERHPRGKVPSSYLIYSKKTDGMLSPRSLWTIYTRELKPYFTELVEKAIGQEDRIRLAQLLSKTWTPYVTECIKKKRLVGKLLNKWFGWTPNSKMASVYENLSEDDAAEALAEYYGLGPKVEQQETIPQLRQCPNVTCKHMNNPDAPFCANPKCRVPLTVAGYMENRYQEEEQKAELQILKDQMSALVKQVSMLSEINQSHMNDYKREMGWVKGEKAVPILLKDGSGRINRLGVEALLNLDKDVENDKKISEQDREEFEYLLTHSDQ